MAKYRQTYVFWNLPLMFGNLFMAKFLVPKVGFEPTRPLGHYALNVARLPFRHFGMNTIYPRTI